MQRRRVLAVSLLLACAAPAGCERRPVRPGNDTAALVTPPPDTGTTPAPPRAAAWDSTAGPALLVATPTPTEAWVVVPAFTEATKIDTVSFDSSVMPQVTVDLFARGRVVGHGTVTTITLPKTDAECSSWPLVHLAPTPPGSTTPPWTVGFASGRAEPIPVDSIEGLPRADSARLAADVARLASALPDDTAAAFRGVPFVVRAVRRFRIDSTEVLVAEVMRRLNEEANPRQEQILLVAERDSASGGKYETVHFERASGAEESLETVDVLAVVRLGAARRPTLVLAREYGEGVFYSLLERTGPRRWRARWTSAYAGC